MRKLNYTKLSLYHGVTLGDDLVTIARRLFDKHREF